MNVYGWASEWKRSTDWRKIGFLYLSSLQSLVVITLSIDSLDSAASLCNKHLTLAFRQTAKESKPSYTEAVSGHLHSVARGGDDDDDDDDDDDGDTLFMCQLRI